MAITTNPPNTYDAASRPIPRSEPITPVRKSNAALYWGIALAILVIAAISWSLSRKRTLEGSSATPTTQQSVDSRPATNFDSSTAPAAAVPATTMEPGTGTGISTGLNRGSMDSENGNAASGVVEPGNGVTNGPSKGAPENAPNTK